MPTAPPEALGPPGVRLLSCGRTGLLVELDTLDEVLRLYTALRADQPPGVIDIVPAARTIVIHLDPRLADRRAVIEAINRARSTNTIADHRDETEALRIPVVYDGTDLADAGELTGWGIDGLIERHTAEEWTVAFCGFAPGFGYLVAASGAWSLPRRSSPRTNVPSGSVALAGEFSGVYPRESPGGWQLIGRTALPTFDIDRDPPALLTPGTKVRFIATDPAPDGTAPDGTAPSEARS